MAAARWGKHGVTVAIALAAGLVLPAYSSAQESVPLRLQKLCKDFAADPKKGHSIVGLGSWIENKKYVLGHSDHDLRLLVPPEMKPDEAAKVWREARDTLRKMIKAEFGAQADKILGKTNLYPPSQIKNLIEDSADAARTFKRYNTVPNLLQEGQVTEKVAAKYTEGLWGKGSQAWTQHYETIKGRLFYSQGGKAYSGVTTLIYAEGEPAKFTAGGMGNTALGWVEHAAEALAEGNRRDLIKHLERIDRDLLKARELAGTGPDEAFRRQIRSLINDLKLDGSVAGNKALIESMLKRSSLEGALLERFDDAGPVQREILDALIKGVRGKEKLGKLLSEAAEKVPVEKLVNGLVVGIILVNARTTAQERSIPEALAKALPELYNLLPAGLLVEITDACLEEAKIAGGVLAASGQDPWDLMAGLDTARGREKGFEREARLEYTLDDLVENFHTERDLEAHVRSRAKEAANREGGEALSKGDLKTAEAIFARCYPTILKAWQAKRDQYRREYIRLVNSIRNARCVMAYDPNPAKMPPDGKPLRVGLEVDFPGLELGETLGRMRELLRLLAGKGPYATTVITFSAVGQEGNRESQWIVRVQKPGKYNTSVKVRFACGSTRDLGENEFLRFDFTKQASVEVEVLPFGDEMGKFSGRFTNTAGSGKGGSTQFSVTGDKVTGYIVFDGGTRQLPLAGTFNAATGQMKATVNHTTDFRKDPEVALDLVWILRADITGTFRNGAFGGTWSGTLTSRAGQKTNQTPYGGTWSAKSAAAPPSRPAKRS